MDTFLKAKYNNKEVVILSLGLGTSDQFIACVLDEGAKQLLTIHTKLLDEVEMIGLQNVEWGGDFTDGEEAD